MTFDRNTADGIDRIEKACVLHHENGFVTGGIHTAANRYSLVFLAHLDHMEILVRENAFEQIMAGHAVRQRYDETNAGAFELTLYRVSRKGVVCHVASS
jgi:hypothetical protein